MSARDEIHVGVEAGGIGAERAFDDALLFDKFAPVRGVEKTAGW